MDRPGAAERTDAPTPGASQPSGYPAHWEADVVLSDGSTVLVRPIRPDDGPLLVAFHERQSPESIYYRYFSPRPRLSARDVAHLTTIDYVDRVAFVALRGDDLVGVARYDRWEHRNEAEVAFFIDDELHGKGMATVMLEHLAARAREVGISSFTASVLPENRKMIGVFTAAGFRAVTRFEEGVIEVRLDLQPTPEAEAAIESRASTAAARAVKLLLAPRSVAVVGASRERGTVGHDAFRNLLRGGFEGPVWPVNPDAVHVASVRAVPSILDIADDVDVAVIALPAELVPAAMEACGRKRVHGVVVLSAGFAEQGEDGARLEAEVLRIARRFGIRLLGPACLGIINTDPAVRLHGTFAGPNPLPGPVALLSESGMIGAAIIDRAREVGIGISSFVGLGNRADVSVNDLLRYWVDDDATDVVCMYIESFGNPRHFSRIARRVSRHKPIVAVRAGRSPGAAAPPGPRDPVTDVLLRQTGVIQARTLAELLDTTRLLVHQPRPAGRRVAIVGNAGGSLALAAQACLDAGLSPLAPRDLGLTAEGADYRDAVEAQLADDDVDAVLAVFAPSLGAGAHAVGAALGEAAQRSQDKPVLACFFGPRVLEVAGSGTSTVPVYDSVEPAARALGKAAVYSEWRAGEDGDPLELDQEVATAVRSAIPTELLGPEHAPLPPAHTWATLQQAGIPMADTRFVPDLDAALAAAEELGWPVVVKARGRHRMAKTQVTGVALDLHDAAGLRQAWETMEHRMGDDLLPAVVQRMEEPGVDIGLSAHVHPVVGPLLALRAGGAAGVLDAEPDVHVLPMSEHDAGRFVQRSHVATVLDAPARDQLCALVARVASLVEAVPEITALELDPIIVRPDAAVPVDAALRVAERERDPLPPVRRVGE